MFIHKKNVIAATTVCCLGLLFTQGCGKKETDDADAILEFTDETSYLAETDFKEETNTSAESNNSTEETEAEASENIGNESNDIESAADQTENEEESETEIPRPTYTASDYMSVGDYTGVTVTDVEIEEITDDDISTRIEYLFEEQGWEFTSIDNLTNEQVAILSNQKYQDVNAYISYVRSFLEERAELYRIRELFIDIWHEVEDTLVFDSFPEDTYKYDTETIDIVGNYAAKFGLTKETMEGIIEEKPAVMDLIIEQVENSLKEEMIINYIADEQGITLDEGEEAEEEQRKIAVMFAYDRYEDMQEDYDQSDIDYYILYMKVADYVVSTANIVSAE